MLTCVFRALCEQREIIDSFDASVYCWYRTRRSDYGQTSSQTQTSSPTQISCQSIDQSHTRTVVRECCKGGDASPPIPPWLRHCSCIIWLLGCQLIYSDSSSLSSTLRLVWCFGFAAMTTSPTLSQFFIGCVYHNGSILRLRSWRSECCMVWLRHTWISWFPLLTCLVVALAAYVNQRHISWTSLHTGWNPSAVGRRINSVEHSAI